YKDGCWSRLKEEHIISPEALIRSTRRRTLFCGEVPSWARLALEERLGSKALFVGTAAALRRAGALAELSWKRLSIGDVDDVTTLQPLYLRRPPVGE
ncbi:MAG: peptidase glycoprotease, partial [Dehalococcoidia bacterium]|nr:peptidase glycoprotease [Dehalococcoidia bacterium]